MTGYVSATTRPETRAARCNKSRWKVIIVADRRSLSLSSVRLVRGGWFISGGGGGSVSAFLLDDGIEPVVFVGGVLDSARGTIGFEQTVETFDVTVAVAGLGLALHVVSARVVYAVHEAVRRRHVGGFQGVSLCGHHLVSHGCNSVSYRCHWVSCRRHLVSWSRWYDVLGQGG